MGNRASFSKLMKPDHLKVVRMLGYVMTGGTRADWWGLVPVLMARLSVEERALLAFMALRSLDNHTGDQTARAALSDGAGHPSPPLFSFMNQAAGWADMAAPEELDAYCLASFQVMSKSRQAAFLEFAQGRLAA